MKTLILGMGNPIPSHGGVGLRVDAEVRTEVRRPDIHLIETELSGLNLLELLVGCDQTIIIDSIQTHDGKPGHIYCLRPESLIDTIENYANGQVKCCFK